eukprot:scaffold45520_cov64-Phaeocystis_antarctica.AAC.6
MKTPKTRRPKRKVMPPIQPLPQTSEGESGGRKSNESDGGGAIGENGNGGGEGGGGGGEGQIHAASH